MSHVTVKKTRNKTFLRYSKGNMVKKSIKYNVARKNIHSILEIIIMIATNVPISWTEKLRKLEQQQTVKTWMQLQRNRKSLAAEITTRQNYI